MSSDFLDTTSIAIAHWNVRAWGGAENLVTKLAEVLDVSQIHTVGEPAPIDPNPYGDVDWVDVTTGPVDWLRKRAGRAGEYALWEDVDWREHGNPDILITSGATTRAVITPDDMLHVNYCHSTPRWLYDMYHDRKSSIIGKLARPAVRHFRLRDQTIDPRVDQYFANSPLIKRRLWKYYKREATVLYPPVELAAYYHKPHENYFLHLGRLDEEKGIQQVVEAFDGRDEQLLLAGGRGDATDSLLDRIETADNMDYRGFVDESEKYDLLARCRAVVFNGVNEDFGIVPIEANASHKPCLVRDDGFPGMFITDGQNGLVHDGTATGIRETLDRVDDLAGNVPYDELIEPFSMDVFERRLHTQLEQFMQQFENSFEQPERAGYDSGPD